MTTQQKTFIITGVIALIAVIGAVYYFVAGKAPEQKQAPELFTGSQQEPVVDQQPQTSNLPDVVARVNGEEIKGTDLQNSEAQILAGQGVDPTTLTDEQRQQLRAQALDILVSNALIRQAAATSGVQASDADIDAQMEVIKGQFEDPAKYQEALTQQKMTEADFRNLVASDVFIQTYIEKTLQLKAIDATDEEVTAMYEQQKTASAEIPPLEEIRDQFKTFVIQQKQQQVLVAHIQELRSKANVEELL
jgi:peptidyl-prolyl cis-trans isomerase SurA